jgi:hypothetical protein
MVNDKYYCTKCEKKHMTTGEEGREHLDYMLMEKYFCKKCKRIHKTGYLHTIHGKYRERSNPIRPNVLPLAAIPIAMAVAPMAIDVGKEIIKDPSLIIKPTGMLRAVGRSFGFGKKIENPPMFDSFQSKHGKRVDVEIDVFVNETKDFSPSPYVFIKYRFLKDEPNVNISVDNEMPESIKVLFTIENQTFIVSGFEEGSDRLFLADPETGEILLRIDRDPYSWIVYPPSGYIEIYKPIIESDKVPEEKVIRRKVVFGKDNPLKQNLSPFTTVVCRYCENEFDYSKTSICPYCGFDADKVYADKVYKRVLPTKVAPRVNSIASIAKAAVPFVKKAVPYIKKGAEYIAKHPEMVTKAGEIISGIKPEPKSPYSPPPQPFYPPSPPHYRINPKKEIKTLEELFDFIGGE